MTPQNILPSIAILLLGMSFCSSQNMDPLLEEEKFIERYEGFSRKAYRDSDGKYTIGYGHKVGGAAVAADHSLTITNQEAVHILEEDITSITALIKRWVHVPLSTGQTDALVSLIYNWGEHNFLRSRGFEYLNQGKYDFAAEEFFSKDRGVVNINGKFSEGLYRRRQAELELWNDQT